MIRIKQILLMMLFLKIINNSIAQNLEFKNLEYASFDLIQSKSKKAKSLNIRTYYYISQSGLVTLYHNDDYHHKIIFAKCKLHSNEVEQINRILKSSRHLRNYVERKSLDSNEYYQGNTNFISVSYDLIKKDSLCFIVPFMSTEFQNLINMFDSIYWYDKSRLKIIKPFPVPNYFRKSLYLNYAKGNLPNKKYLPSFRK